MKTRARAPPWTGGAADPRACRRGNAHVTAVALFILVDECTPCPRMEDVTLVSKPLMPTLLW